MLDDLSRWAKRSYIRTKVNGLEGASKSLFQLYRGLWQLGEFVPRGTNIFEHEWDLLLILDSCRVDLMREVADEYDYITDVESISSVGSDSVEWINKTFKDEYVEEIRNSAYITANPFSEGALGIDGDLFDTLDEVWKYGFDDALGTIPPEIVTDRTIELGRMRNVDRTLVHYMQPHHPFIAQDSPLRKVTSIGQSVKKRSDGKEWEPGDIGKHAIWRMYKRGEVTYDELWESYRKTLYYVLDSVGLLLENYDADRVVITSDHGNATGEWMMYGHSAGFLHPAVTQVPWIETSGVDTGDYEPDSGVEHTNDHDMDEILNSLGYKQ